MSTVAVEKIDEKKVETATVFKELKELSERIRKHAFEIFEKHNGGEGFDMEDWLKAERDLLCMPESEFLEKDGKFEIRMNAPGFEADEVKVTALSDAIIVNAASTHTHDENEGKVRFCEFGHKTLFRRFDLPEKIELDKVTASLDKGMLLLTALKAKTGEAEPKKIAIAA
jgi:HSP20 family protein